MSHSNHATRFEYKVWWKIFDENTTTEHLVWGFHMAQNKSNGLPRFRKLGVGGKHYFKPGAAKSVPVEEILAPAAALAALVCTGHGLRVVDASDSLSGALPDEHCELLMQGDLTDLETNDLQNALKPVSRAVEDSLSAAGAAMLADKIRAE